MLLNDFLNFNKTVRAVIVDGSHLLLCREKGSRWHFLPGWRVDYREKIEKALAKNVEQNFMAKIEHIKYIGATSTSYQIDRYKTRQDFDLIYLVRLPEHIDISENGEIEFVWHPVDEIRKQNIAPRILKDKLAKWFQDQEFFWAST
jgi:ADP-ribose pyrophosphatase YjhB (NUDIX family)